MSNRARNVFIALSAATLAAALLAKPALSQPLTVAFYGGEWGDAITACIVEPFKKTSGASVTPDP